MDEDASDVNEANEEDIVRQRITQESRKNRKSNATCRTRIDQLATPNKRIILNLYQEHAKHFPKDRVERIKHKLQELYAMTPEETERYFEEMKAEERRAELRDRLKRMLKKQYLRDKRKKQQQKAYRFVEKLLRNGMRAAFEHPVPPLVSVRLRNLSDIILEQLCDLRNIDHPSRENPDKEGSFMIAVADWAAIAIEHVYYIVQLKKNMELEEIEKQKRAEVVKKDETVPDSPKKTETDEADTAEKNLPEPEDETVLSKTADDLYFE
ncbi:uncharacterized protein [Leptinotarsa decemlineata]|uniref:uncharacterized protein n=1 Tax=Leptinotarsa decemlineata TaxID=7539 RepID=UPI003D30BA95